MELANTTTSVGTQIGKQNDRQSTLSKFSRKKGQRHSQKKQGGFFWQHQLRTFVENGGNAHCRKKDPT